MNTKERKFIDFFLMDETKTEKNSLIITIYRLNEKFNLPKKEFFPETAPCYTKISNFSQFLKIA